MNWVLFFQVAFGILGLIFFVTIAFFLLAFMTKLIQKRRYKPENDIGRPREEFSRSLSTQEPSPGIRMDNSNRERPNMEEAIIDSSRQPERIPQIPEPDYEGDGEVSRIHSNEPETLEEFKRRLERDYP